MEGAEVSTITVRVFDEGATLVRKLANFEGVTISDFARTVILERIEDSYDLHELRAAIAVDDGQRFSINEILGKL